MCFSPGLCISDEILHLERADICFGFIYRVGLYCVLFGTIVLGSIGWGFVGVDCFRLYWVRLYSIVAGCIGGDSIVLCLIWNWRIGLFFWIGMGSDKIGFGCIG